LNAYLIKKDGKGHKTRFYNFTEPFFVGMTRGYAKWLRVFMDKKWLSFPILFICFALIALFWNTLKKETAPYEDRSQLNVSAQGPEGATYEYMDRFMMELSDLVNDSIPEKDVNLVNTSPGYGGSGAANRGSMRLTLVPPGERERSQEEIMDALSRQTKQFSEARTFVTQRPTIAVSRRGGMPIQYIIQAPNFEKLEEKIPEFLEMANA